MMSYKLLLIEWKLQDFIKHFDDEEIDDETFPILDDETIKQIFQKNGPRLKFLQHYKAYLAKQNKPCCLTINDSVSTASTDTLDTTYSYAADEELLAILENNSDISTKESNLPLKEKGYFRTLPDEIVPVKRIKVDSCFPEGLENILKKTTEGQIVLLNKQKLNNDHRQKLSKIVISELTGIYGIDIKTSTLSNISDEIIELFPYEEKDTYFIPSQEGGPKGKLWYRYTNVRAALKGANVQKKVPKTPTPVSSPVREEDQLYLDFLKVATEPFDKIVEFWEASYKTRRRLYMNATLADIFDNFPCLKLDRGIELIESDFNKKFPDKADLIYSSFPNVCTAIISEVEERKINVCDSKCSDVALRAILSLPYLFPPTTLRKSRKGVSWRPTRVEILDSFFASFKSYDEIDVRHQLRKTKLESVGLTLQPYVAVVGEVSNPEFYLIIDDHVRYNVKGSIHALDVTFKLYHALDIEYPPESEHIWLLIGDLIYRLQPSKKNPCTASVLADLKFHLNQ